MGALAPLLLVHLSDIHFHYKWSGHSYDRDEHVRDDLENDLRELVANVGTATALVATGDLAYQGDAAEFEIARDWLERVAAIAGCGADSILAIPGNHDVRQSVIKENPYIRDFQKTICASSEGVDGAMQTLLTDAIKGPLIFAALDEYGRFAERYGCWSTNESPYWERVFPIDETINLRIRGVNSAITSSNEDGHEPKNQLAVGAWQARMRREEGTVNMLLCHHPAGWLVDEQSFDQITQARQRAPIQLFGHEHELQIDPTDHCLRIHAGAVHPSRSQPGWVPRYNLVGIRTAEENGQRLLKVKVWARAWNVAEDAFGPDHKFCREFEPFEWTIPISIAHEHDQAELEGEPLTVEEGRPPAIVRNQLAAEQRLVSSFVQLPQQDINSIASRLGLVEDADFGKPRQELLRRYFERARLRSSGLQNLWDEVSSRSAGLQGVENPFDEERSDER